MEKYNPNAYKPIKENPIILDFSGCKYLGEIHGILKEKFGFPDYYGENWDALRDPLEDMFYGMGDWLVEIHGFVALEPEMRSYCQTMLKIFEDVQKGTPNVKFVLIS